MDSSDATIPWGHPSDVIKVLVQPLTRLERPFVITGRRCEDGRALRFAKGLPDWAPPPASPPALAVIESRTQAEFEIAATPPYLPDGYVSAVVEGGYFIFTAPGRWQVEVRDGERLIRAFVIVVRDDRAR